MDAAQGLTVQLEGSTRDPRLDYKLYQLSLATSDIPQAGTDGDVYVDLVGATGSTGWRKVSPAGSQVGRQGAMPHAIWIVRPSQHPKLPSRVHAAAKLLS